MKTVASRVSVIAGLFALYMVHPMLGFAGLAGAFYVFMPRGRSRREQPFTSADPSSTSLA
jgi:hypothetical protein